MIRGAVYKFVTVFEVWQTYNQVRPQQGGAESNPRSSHEDFISRPLLKSPAIAHLDADRGISGPVFTIGIEP